MNGSGQPRLQLVPLTPDDVRAQIDAMNEDEKSQLSPRWLDAMRHLTTVDPWLLGFAVVDQATGMSIGSCGFKGPPDAEGMVEIAYGIAADHRNMGYATEAAEALVAYAVASGRVRIVRAHTLSEANASARVLTKCAFRRLGQVIDPEDGLVWRWERRTEGEQ